MRANTCAAGRAPAGPAIPRAAAAALQERRKISFKCRMPDSQPRTSTGNRQNSSPLFTASTENFHRLLSRFTCAPGMSRLSCSPAGKCDTTFNTASGEKRILCLHYSKTARISPFCTQEQGFGHTQSQGGVAAWDSSPVHQDRALLLPNLSPLPPVLLLPGPAWKCLIQCPAEAARALVNK